MRILIIVESVLKSAIEQSTNSRQTNTVAMVSSTLHDLEVSDNDNYEQLLKDKAPMKPTEYNVPVAFVAFQKITTNAHDLNSGEDYNQLKKSVEPKTLAICTFNANFGAKITRNKDAKDDSSQCNQLNTDV